MTDVTLFLNRWELAVKEFYFSFAVKMSLNNCKSIHISIRNGELNQSNSPRPRSYTIQVHMVG